MVRRKPSTLDRVALWLKAALSRIEVLALFAIVALTAHVLGLADVVLVTAFALPVLLILQNLLGASKGVDGPLNLEAYQGHDALLALLDYAASQRGKDSACFLVQVDGWADQVDRFGADNCLDIADRCRDRMAAALRVDDVIEALGDGRFGIVLRPIATARVGIRDVVASRLRSALAEPLIFDGTKLRLSASIGHASLQRDANDPAATTFAAAETALIDALDKGPGVLRGYAPAMLAGRAARVELSEAVEDALISGEITAWFQPQIDTVTGVISGFEALARWHHPQRGLLFAAEFLEAVDDAGQAQGLNAVILAAALSSLKEWDTAGLRVPSVSVNMTATDMISSGEVDHILTALTDAGLSPDRLKVELRQTEVQSIDQAALITAIKTLRDRGVGIDLDDFGVGGSNVDTLDRLPVDRVKIHQSFLAEIERDADKQATLLGIVAMAGHTHVSTVAKGVETGDAQTWLARAGCHYVQGVCVASPMPFEDCITWATLHNERLAQNTKPHRRLG